MATAHNVEGNYWNINEDQRDGTGVVKGREAELFALNFSRINPNNTAVEHGICAASWQQTDNNTKSFNIRVPNPKPSGKHLRIVLTWDSNARTDVSLNDLTDFDISIVANGMPYSSMSWNSNNEIIDVPSSRLTAGSTYTVQMSHPINRIPSGSYTYYSIGWTWVKD